MVDSFEKIPVEISQTPEAGSHHAAKEIANLIRQKQKEGKTCVLGLATGSTPITMYKELVRLHKEDEKQHCIQYEQTIDDAGGIDLQVLGIGNNGHIGFNEPGSSIFSKTRLT